MYFMQVALDFDGKSRRQGLTNAVLDEFFIGGLWREKHRLHEAHNQVREFTALIKAGLWLISLFVCLFSLMAAADGVATISNETVTYIVTDPAGSPLIETDANGKVISQVRYQPYGEPQQLVGSPPTTGGDAPGFEGKIVDRTTGLSYFGARYYNPKSGRFMSVDPTAAQPGDPHQFNRYSFANDNPYRFVDPDGRESEENDDVGNYGPKNWPEELGDFSSAMGPGRGYTPRGQSRALTPLENAEANKMIGESPAPGSVEPAIKSVPNPYGKVGSPAHQAEVNNVASDIKGRGLTPTKELRIETGGLKNEPDGLFNSSILHSKSM